MVLLMFNEEKDDWDILTKEEKGLLPKDIQEQKVFYLDGIVKQKLDFAMEQQEKDNDCPIVIVGEEGSGKSSLAGNCARYTSKDKFDAIKHMIGDEQDGGLQKLMSIEDGGTLIFDEFGQSGSSVDTMTRKSKGLMKVFQIIRQKKLIVFFIIPSFFRLQSYFAVDRSKFLLKTYLVNGDRSHFGYYGQKKKEKLYRHGKKNNDYGCVSPTFRGRFTRCYKLECKEYKEFKRRTLAQALTFAMDVGNKPKTEAQLQSDLKKDLIRKNLDTPTAQLAELFDMTARRIRQLKVEIRAEHKGGSIS